MALTKSDIVASIHDLGLTKKKSVEVIEGLLEIIKRSLESSEDVLISGFGKFCVKDKAKRRGRNPATGQDLTTFLLGLLQARAPDAQQEVFGAFRRLRHVVLEDVMSM